MKDSTNSVREQQIYNILNSNNYNKAAKCAILASIQTLSNYDPNKTRPKRGTTYRGILLQDPTKMNAYTAPKPASTPSLQISYFIKKFMPAQTDYRQKTIKCINSNTLEGAQKAVKTLITALGWRASDITQAKLKVGFYWEEYSKPKPPSGSSPGTDDTLTEEESLAENAEPATPKGHRIVQVARLHKGDPYEDGGKGPDSFDNPGFVYYCYNAAGVELKDCATADAYYKEYKGTARSVTKVQASAGDLLFYTKSGKIVLVAICNGDGGKIYMPEKGVVLGDADSLGLDGYNLSYILRIVEDTETSQGEVPESEEQLLEEYVYLSNYDPYKSIISQNLSKIESRGYDYSYLIDMTHGGEFKFYIPEFSEQAGANWTNIEIVGRSSSVLAYEYTNSRSVTISLDLFAGEGLYIMSDPVTQLYKDLNFLKSLEYPDYSNPIVRPPSTVHLVLNPAVSFRGVVSEVSVDYKKPLDSQNRSMYAHVSFKVTETETNPSDYSDIRNRAVSMPGTETNNSNILNSTGSDQSISSASDTVYYTTGGSGKKYAFNYVTGSIYVEYKDGTNKTYMVGKAGYSNAKAAYCADTGFTDTEEITKLIEEGMKGGKVPEYIYTTLGQKMVWNEESKTYDLVVKQ